MALIMWQIEKAYFGITLEPEDLIEDDEAAEKDMKKPIAPAKKQVVVPALTVKSGTSPKPAAKKQSSRKIPTPVTTTARLVATPKRASQTAKKDVPIISQKQPAMTKPAAINAEQEKKELIKLHDTFAAVPQETRKQVQPSLDEGKKYKLTKKNAFSMIEAYAGADYTYFSFSKIRKELGAVNEKDALKLKKFLLNACGLGYIVKKGSKYFIQRE